MQDIKVLIADDEPDILQIMQRRVTEAGYTVVTAADGEEAWQKIESESPDIILLDLMMPKMDGFTVLKQLREHPPSQKWQPVIIVSARSDLEDMKKGFSMDADHYITKPCDMEAVLKGIRLLANLRAQRKSAREMSDT